MTKHTLSLSGVELVYDILGSGGGRPLVMVGQPMTADGFYALASHLDDRTVITYDPRGLGRSVRTDGRDDQNPVVQAEDLHALVTDLGRGQVDVFASSGGAVTALAWVTAHPSDVATLVAHEPPLLEVLPDAAAATRAVERFKQAYSERGWGAGMAAFGSFMSWPGEFTDAYFAQPAADPAAFGIPAEDDGTRDDPLLSDRAVAVIEYTLDVDALQAAPTRTLLGVGEETGDAFTGRTARATAFVLGTEAVVFPSHHGGFGGEDSPRPGEATKFAVRLREVLARA